MKYRVKHTTEYFYGDAVPLCHNIFHLNPRNTEMQKCLSNTVTITPEPATRRDRVDFFGNHVTCFAIQSPHRKLNIVAESFVEVKPYEVPAGFDGGSWEATAAMLASPGAAGTLYARQYTFDSPRVPRNDELAEFARPCFKPGGSLLESVNALNERIYEEFTFDSNATNVNTPVMEVLRHRHGVCQDFAHLMAGSLRSMGLAARYVSGYLLTAPDGDQPRLAGVDASHAWVSVFFPEVGWIDFDPTNGLIPKDQHITLGWARDYDDICPVKGVITGGHQHYLSFFVDVEPIEAPEEGQKAVKSEA